jgi:hypothetical protein
LQPDKTTYKQVICSLSTAASSPCTLTQHTVLNWPGPVIVLLAAVLLMAVPPGQLRVVPLPKGLAQVPSTVAVADALLLVTLASIRGSETWLV